MSTTVTIPRDADTEQQHEVDAELQREGSVHLCQGPLRRKRHRAQTKINKWKQKWFKIEPGEISL